MVVPLLLPLRGHTDWIVASRHQVTTRILNSSSNQDLAASTPRKMLTGFVLDGPENDALFTSHHILRHQQVMVHATAPMAVPRLATLKPWYSASTIRLRVHPGRRTLNYGELYA